MTLCVCGCGRETFPGSKYASPDRCRQRAYDNRRAARAAELGVSARPSLTQLAALPARTPTGRQSDAPVVARKPTGMKPSARRCLELLRSRERVTVTDMLAANVGVRYSARILELRLLGFVIASDPVPGRAGYVYRLIAEPDAGLADRQAAA